MYGASFAIHSMVGCEMTGVVLEKMDPEGDRITSSGAAIRRDAQGTIKFQGQVAIASHPTLQPTRSETKKRFDKIKSQTECQT